MICYQIMIKINKLIMKIKFLIFINNYIKEIRKYKTIFLLYKILFI